jgi:hypothetical protein
MISLTNRIVYSVLFFILSMILVNLLKPTVMFNSDETLKSFGINKNETVFSLGVFTTLSSIVSFYFFCMIDLIFS